MYFPAPGQSKLMPMPALSQLLCLLALLISAAPSFAATATTCGDRERLAVQVLGSGGPIADDGRASSAYLVWVDGAARALIDAGGGAFLRFGQAGARFEDLDFIGLSHYHTDHSADLPALLKSGYFSQRTRPLAVAGPGPGGPFPGLDGFLQGMLDPERGAYGYLSGYLDGSGGLVKLAPAEVPAGSGETPGLAGPMLQRFRVDALPVPHGIVPAIAFRLTLGNTVLIFAGDQNGGDPAFAEFARQADLLVMHMAIPQGAGGAALKLHATPETVGRVAQAAGARKLLLSHFMARSLRELEANLARVRQHYPGPVEVAGDLACVVPAG